jgi:hypothetical protein
MAATFADIPREGGVMLQGETIERSGRLRVALRATALAMLVGGLGGCAGLSAPAAWQPGNLQPLIIGWQQYFRIQWAATPGKGGALVDGYITNTWGFTAQRVRVLVTGHDAAGKEVGQLVAWGPSEINPGGRVYFDVEVPGGAAHYDVSIFSWNWVQVGMNVDVP